MVVTFTHLKGEGMISVLDLQILLEDTKNRYMAYSVLMQLTEKKGVIFALRHAEGALSESGRNFAVIFQGVERLLKSFSLEDLVEFYQKVTAWKQDIGDEITGRLPYRTPVWGMLFRGEFDELLSLNK